MATKSITQTTANATGNGHKNGKVNGHTSAKSAPKNRITDIVDEVQLPVARHIECESITIRDAKGMARIMMSGGSVKSYPHITMFDHKGDPVVEIGTWKDDCNFVRVRTEDGKASMALVGFAEEVGSRCVLHGSTNGLMKESSAQIWFSVDGETKTTDCTITHEDEKGTKNTRDLSPEDDDQDEDDTDRVEVAERAFDGSGFRIPILPLADYVRYFVTSQGDLFYDPASYFTVDADTRMILYHFTSHERKQKTSEIETLHKYLDFVEVRDIDTEELDPGFYVGPWLAIEELRKQIEMSGRLGELVYAPR